MCTTVYVHAHVCVFSESHGKNTERRANSSYAPCFKQARVYFIKLSTYVN